MLEDIVGIVLVENGRALFHGLHLVEDKGQLFIFHLDLAGGLGGGHFVFGHHGGHVIAVIANMPVQQAAVSHVLMGGFHRPGVACGGELDVRHVKAGEDFHHAGHFFCFGSVNGFYVAVGDGGTDNADDQRVFVAQIVGVFGSAGRFVERIHTGYALANVAHTVSLLCFVENGSGSFLGYFDIYGLNYTIDVTGMKVKS